MFCAQENIDHGEVTTQITK